MIPQILQKFNSHGWQKWKGKTKMEMLSGKEKQPEINKLLNKWEETTCIFKVTFDKIHLILCSLEAPSVRNFGWTLPLLSLAPWLMRKWNVFGSMQPCWSSSVLISLWLTLCFNVLRDRRSYCMRHDVEALTTCSQSASQDILLESRMPSIFPGPFLMWLIGAHEQILCSRSKSV